MAKALCSREKDYSQWYNDLVVKAQLADHSAVRGCMVIRPYGYAIWEMMKDYLDAEFKKTGHVNAAFPLFIPKSFLSKEAAHVEGFAKECAVVTHYRLKNDPDGGGVIVDPDAKLEEELIVRPTSETIIWNTYKDWIQSYRDLPLLINQWANVVRWEMRTRLFLRTSEFFWQEGHTAHATREEAVEEAKLMHNVYADFMESQLCVPVLKGTKSESERFAGAEETYTCEGLMQDGKALQMGTSHFLGQNFAKAFDVKFQDKDKKTEFVWATSWGVSTRLMGALIMAHSDDEGLVLPPKLAPIQVVVVPIYFNDDDKQKVLAVADEIRQKVEALNIRIKVDLDDKYRPGYKFAEYELKGVPLRIAIGPKDLQKGTVELSRRDTKEKSYIDVNTITEVIEKNLEDMQVSLFKAAKKRVTENTHTVDTFEEFEAAIDRGGFVFAHWDGSSKTEEEIKKKTKATIRSIPLDNPGETGRCVFSGNPSKQRVYFAKAY